MKYNKILYYPLYLAQFQISCGLQFILLVFTTSCVIIAAVGARSKALLVSVHTSGDGKRFRGRPKFGHQYPCWAAAQAAQAPEGPKTFSVFHGHLHSCVYPHTYTHN